MDNGIAIVTDSTSDLPRDILENSSIHCIPLKVIFNDKEQFKDRIEITPKEVYDNIEDKTPTTSMPSPQQFVDKYSELKEKGFNKIISLHLSQNLSGTYNVAKTVSQQMDEIQIEVIDSKSASMGLGRLALYAEQMAKDGNNFNEIVSNVKKNINNIEIYVVVETLKYLKRGGRIGKIAGTVGEILSIKPIVSIDGEGELYTYDKSRGRKRSLKRLLNIVDQEIKNDLCNIDIMHTNSLDDAKKVRKKLEKRDNIRELTINELGPVIGVHTGPGLIGAVITNFEK